MQLPYFDFAELANARQLANWMRQGATVQSIKSQLESLRKRVPSEAQAESVPLTQLSIVAEGKRLVLRSGDAFVEANGQLRFGFDLPLKNSFSDCRSTTHALDGEASDDRALTAEAIDESVPSTLPFVRSQRTRAMGSGSDSCVGDRGVCSLAEMVEEAIVAEDADDLPAAVDWYRSAQAAYGPNPDICFQLAELLYRQGDLSGARERYFMALELNPELVEARANLGCVLAECGQTELAIAAFEGTLEQFADYADVHFHLARALDDCGQQHRAAEHWKKFLDLAPASPWAEEAEQRLRHLTPLLEF
jgi:tetratricopeptide (TPR) repeat protein